MRKHTSTDTDTRTRKESTLIQRIYYHNKRKRSYPLPAQHICTDRHPHTHHTTHTTHHTCHTPVHTPHTTQYKAPLQENQRDILTWWRTWARRMHIRTFNGTVKIGNTSAWGFGWAWNLHGAQTRLLCKKPPHKTSEGTQKLFQIPPQITPRGVPTVKKQSKAPKSWIPCWNRKKLWFCTIHVSIPKTNVNFVREWRTSLLSRPDEKLFFFKNW